MSAGVLPKAVVAGAARRLVVSALSGLLLGACAASTVPPAQPVSQSDSTSGHPVAQAVSVAGGASRIDDDRWTGLALEPVTEALARRANLRRVEGLYVDAVEADSPGARAGVRRGDVVLLAEGIYLGDPSTLARVLAEGPVGGTIALALRRGSDILAVALPLQRSPAGRLLFVIEPPQGLTSIAADGRGLWAYGMVPGGVDRGIVPIQLPEVPSQGFGSRAVASAGAERVIAVDAERVYLGWAGFEIYIDFYELASGRVGRLTVKGAETLANRCQPRGLARVRGEIWMVCQRPEGPVVAAVDLATGQTRIERLPPSYITGLAFDGEAVLWLCCAIGGHRSLTRRDLASGAVSEIPLNVPARDVAADGHAVYLLSQDGQIYAHRHWR
jgi:PDZ domain